MIKYDKRSGLYYGSDVTPSDLDFAEFRAKRIKHKLGDVEKITVTASYDNSITLHVETKEYVFDQKIFRSEFWEVR